MHRSYVAQALIPVALLLTSGCGYIGYPLTPLANVPLPVADLAAVQRADLLIVHGAVPTHTTEAQLIKTPLKLELRIGPAREQFKADEWASQAKEIAGVDVKNGRATCQIPSREWTGKEVVIGMRVAGPNGKPSDWVYQVLRIVPPPEVPSFPTLEPTANGVHVTWTGRGDQFRVLRRTGKDENYIVAATGATHEWTDTGIEYGKTYTYMMQALVDVGNQKVAESSFSDTKAVTPEDKFPPAVPSGLHADAAPTSVALGWEANTEADLAGYRIYRSVGDGAWQKLADGNTVPSYSDMAVEAGKTYRYAISAVDKAGNESARCAAVDVTL